VPVEAHHGRVVGQRGPWVMLGTNRPTAIATAAAPKPVRHHASQVRSAASHVRRDASVVSAAGTSPSGPITAMLSLFGQRDAPGPLDGRSLVACGVTLAQHQAALPRSSWSAMRGSSRAAARTHSSLPISGLAKRT
jgi:hypothetical protein